MLDIFDMWKVPRFPPGPGPRVGEHHGESNVPDHGLGAAVDISSSTVDFLGHLIGVVNATGSACGFSTGEEKVSKDTVLGLGESVCTPAGVDLQFSVGTSSLSKVEGLSSTSAGLI
jgi:hypothetical protein